MTREEIEQNIGRTVKLNGCGDLALHAHLRTDGWYRVVKLTKGGMAYLKSDDNKIIVVPPKNVDLVEKEQGGQSENYSKEIYKAYE